MISIMKCREILGKAGEKYTDQQLEVIRHFLVSMAKINVEVIKQHKKKKDEESSDNVQG